MINSCEVFWLRNIDGALTAPDACFVHSASGLPSGDALSTLCHHIIVCFLEMSMDWAPSVQHSQLLKQIGYHESLLRGSLLRNHVYSLIVSPTGAMLVFTQRKLDPDDELAFNHFFLEISDLHECASLLLFMLLHCPLDTLGYQPLKVNIPDSMRLGHFLAAGATAEVLAVYSNVCMLCMSCFCWYPVVSLHLLGLCAVSHN